jgi:hypothetical protein
MKQETQRKSVVSLVTSAALDQSHSLTLYNSEMEREGGRRRGEKGRKGRERRIQIEAAHQTESSNPPRM